MANMENLKVGTKVKVSEQQKKDNYYCMNWVHDDLIITHTHKDNEGIGLLYSFDSISSDREITCSLYGWELELI